MAVRDDLPRVAETRANLICGQRRSGLGEELLNGQVARARNPTLAWIARVSVLAPELFLCPDVEDQQRFVVEPAGELLACRHCFEARLEGRLHGLQLDLSDLQLAGPGGHATQQNRHAWMAGELRHLGGRHRSDTVA